MSTALLLALGAAWWVHAAPGDQADKRIEQWRKDASTLLPDRQAVIESDSLTLGASTEQEVVASPGPGNFQVSVVCVGGPGSRARVTLGELGLDSGHGMDCGSDREPDAFSVSVVDDLRMNVSVSDSGPVVFRYTLLRETPG
ncbi:hypothetical protein HH310_13140 [Actinoplanes sp. TBRC 11911]|nr:hypothetical protein [Actinoplanes sp. TBRC 11911]